MSAIPDSSRQIELTRIVTAGTVAERPYVPPPSTYDEFPSVRRRSLSKQDLTFLVGGGAVVTAFCIVMIAALAPARRPFLPTNALKPPLAGAVVSAPEDTPRLHKQRTGSHNRPPEREIRLRNTSPAPVPPSQARRGTIYTLDLQTGSPIEEPAPRSSKDAQAVESGDSGNR